MDTKDGLPTAVALLIEQSALTPDRQAAVKKKFGEQLALIPMPALGGELIELEPAGDRGPGRPPGARNRSTEQWVKVILATKRSPLEFLTDVYSRPVELLAAEIGCDRKEALQMQIRCAEATLPYLHQKQATSAEEAAAALLTVILPAAGAALASQRAENGGTLTVPRLVIDHKENQPLSDDGLAQV